MMRFQNQVALVTGGARGIGAATALRLAEEGAAVVIADVLEVEGARLAAEIRRREGRAVYEHLDVMSETQWRRAIDRAATLGRLKVLVNNAAIARSEDVERETIEGYTQVIAVNQTGAWLGMKSVAPELKKNGGGVIVNVSSSLAVSGGAGEAFAYHTSKGALAVMTKNAAIRWAKDRIRVCSIHPGLVDTPMIAPFADSVMRAQVHATTPMQRIGRPDEIAAAIAFLASSDASYVTGSALFVDGGYSAR